MFTITSMITFSVVAWYSQTIPLAPAGSSDVAAVGGTPTAFGSVEVPSADCTELPEGQDVDAATAVGATVGVGAVAVAVGAPAADDDDAGVLEPPQAASRAPKPTAVKGIQSDWLRVTSAPPSIVPRYEPPSGAL
jgi:hypothetical protein